MKLVQLNAGNFQCSPCILGIASLKHIVSDSILIIVWNGTSSVLRAKAKAKKVLGVLGVCRPQRLQLHCRLRILATSRGLIHAKGSNAIPI